MSLKLLGSPGLSGESEAFVVDHGCWGVQGCQIELEAVMEVWGC